MFISSPKLRWFFLGGVVTLLFVCLFCFLLFFTTDGNMVYLYTCRDFLGGRDPMLVNWFEKIWMFSEGTCLRCEDHIVKSLPKDDLSDLLPALRQQKSAWDWYKVCARETSNCWLPSQSCSFYLSHFCRCYKQKKWVLVHFHLQHVAYRYMFCFFMFLP